MQTLDERVAFLEGRVDGFETPVEGQIAALDQKMSRQFLWLMGALTTVLVTMIGSLAGVVLTLG